MPLSLLDFPAEVRLQIFSYIEDSHETRTINIALNCNHRVEPDGCATLAALSRSCRTIHHEVAERLYRYRTFNVDILSGESLMGLWRLNFAEDFTFLIRMQSVRLAISINTGRRKLSIVFSKIRAVLEIFSTSKELRDFTVYIGEIHHLAARHNHVNDQLRTLRQDCVASGIVDGKTVHEIELDVAWRALEFFENGFRRGPESLTQHHDCTVRTF